MLSRILEEKDEHVMQRDAVIHRLEHDISANKAQVDTLLKQVPHFQSLIAQSLSQVNNLLTSVTYSYKLYWSCPLSNKM